MALVRRAESMVARAQRMRARMEAAREAHRLPLLAKEAQHWTFLAAVPPREVFAVIEQMLGSFPFRYELTGESSARIVEFRRKGLVGQWSKRVAIHTRWVTCEARPTASGTVVTVVASRGRGPVPRALQLVSLLSRGSSDPRPLPAPGDPLRSGQPGRLLGRDAIRLYTEPRWEAPRGERVLTASGVEAIPVGRVPSPGSASPTVPRASSRPTRSSPLPRPPPARPRLEAARFV